MATNTTNLGLTKPDLAEGYDVNVFNTNADILDGAVGALIAQSGNTEKLDTLINDVAEVKADTTALIQALEMANQNINTLLQQTGSVKTVYNGTSTTDVNTGIINVNIPATMNANKCIVYTNTDVRWTKNGAVITFVVGGGGGKSFNYQLIEFY
jgi:hypothetical protein